MYNYITGRVTNIYANYIVLENHGIGYIIKTPNPYVFKLNEDITIYTHVYLRQDIFDIYGFRTNQEKDLFIKLISVKGLGPKGALAILANGDINQLEQAIESADTKYLQRFPGIGQKASSQIILDLKGKLTRAALTREDSKMTDVKEALKSLGYHSSELKKLDNYLSANLDKPIEELIKNSLKLLI